MRVVITCGGTGGHIYPAISLADALKELENAEILFIGTDNHMEAKLIPEAGYAFKSCKAIGLNGSVFNKIKAIFTMLSSVSDAKRIIQDFNADIIVGFGGYVSAPVCLAAHSLKVPVILHEQNSYAGKANLFLERYASAVVSCYKNVENQFKNKPYLLGNPRTYTAKKKQDFNIYVEYGLERNKNIVLFVMGSQGSESVNAKMKNVLHLLENKDFNVIYVTGRNHTEEFKDEYAKNIHLLPYINQVGCLDKICLLVTRGGATTASEIGIFKVPSIIIPSPYVPNNHQELNAKALVEMGGAILKKENELNDEELAKEIDELVHNEEKLRKMKENSSKIGYPNAAEDIISLMKEYVK